MLHFKYLVATRGQHRYRAFMSSQKVLLDSTVLDEKCFVDRVLWPKKRDVWINTSFYSPLWRVVAHFSTDGLSCPAAKTSIYLIRFQMALTVSP